MRNFEYVKRAEKLLTPQLVQMLTFIHEHPTECKESIQRTRKMRTMLS